MSRTCRVHDSRRILQRGVDLDPRGNLLFGLYPPPSLKLRLGVTKLRFMGPLWIPLSADSVVSKEATEMQKKSVSHQLIAGVSLLAVAAGAVALSAEPSFADSYMAGDFHNHTPCSDG